VAAPTPAPSALLKVSGSTVTATRQNAAEAGATYRLYRRTNGSTDSWTLIDSDASPAVGTILTDSSVANGSYEYEVRDENVGGEQTTAGRRWCGVTVQASTWDTVLAALRASIEAQGVPSTDIYDGEEPESNYSDQAYILRPLEEEVLARANGDLVLRLYPVQIEYRTIVQDEYGEERMQNVRDAHDTIIELFDGATPADFPSLSALERMTTVTETKNDRALTDELDDEVISRVRVNVPIWETR